MSWNLTNHYHFNQKIRGREMINLYNGDCLEAMREMKDNEFDLAIVDPPYGMKELGAQTGGKGGMEHLAYHNGSIDKWDSSPDQEYFDEIRRVSKNQIIWGGNYFTNRIPESREWICWDKKQFMPTFSRFELAWTSFKGVMKMFEYRHFAVEEKVHPCQKPVALYTWLLDKYAKEGDKILDTHLGSGSIAIACHNLGYSLDAFELDPDYYAAACQRLRQHQRQLRLF